MDDNSWNDIPNINLDEETFQRLVDEVINESDREMNVHSESLTIERLGPIAQRVQQEGQHENFQSTQLSNNLPSSGWTDTTQALLQNQQPEYYALDRLTLTDQKLLRERQNEIFQSTQPSTSLSSSDLTRTTQALLQKQPPDYTSLGLRSQRVEGRYQHVGFPSPQPSTSLPPSEFHAAIDTLLQNQDHSQTSLMSDMQQTPQFQAEESAFITSQEVPSSETVIHKDFASAAPRQRMQHPSHQQKVCSYVTPILLPPPLTSMSVQNPQACMIPQEQKPSSKNSPDDRPMEPNQTQMISLEDMEILINSFKRTRKILGFSRKEVSFVLDDLSDERVSRFAICNFERFSTIFEEVRYVKHYMELILEDIQTSRRTSHSLLNTSESIDSSLSTEGVTGRTQQQDLGNVFLQNPKPIAETFAMTNFNPGMYGAVSINRQGKTTNEAPENRMSQQVIDNSENVRPLCQLPQSQPEETISLQQMQQSAETLWRKRIELNLDQNDVSLEVKNRYGIRITQQDISKFETFNEFIGHICCLKRAMEKWLKDIHISETQDLMSVNSRQVLERAFAFNSNPEAHDISMLATSVHLDYELVTIWFQKYCQIKECTKSPTNS